MSDLPFREKNRDRRVVTWLLLGLVVLFGGLYVAGYLFTSDKVPRGTTVAGIDIGGLSPTAAERTLERELARDANRPIVVSADDERHRIVPAAAGLGIDYAESVAQAGAGRSWSPARMWDFFAGGDDLDPVVTVEGDKLTGVIGTIAETLDKPAREGDIRFEDGTAEPRLPRTGQAIDQDEAADVVIDAYPAGPDAEIVALPVDVVEPEITESDVSAAMDEFANPAMAAPVIIRLADKDVVLRPEDYSHALSLKKEDGELVPALDEKALLRTVNREMRGVALEPQPATVKLVNGTPRVVPGKDGVTFDPDDVTDKFLTLVTLKDDKRVLEIDAKVDRPDFTVADARDLKIKEVVSSFTTYFPHAEYRNVNLGRAAELINGTVLKPGEIFSLNDTVGERTAENGFTKGFIISDGVYKEDFGGGVSQVATTTFNAAFFAGLEDIEHKPHSFYIDRYPIGREATVVWGAVDLKFRNDTPYGVLIEAWVVPSTVSSQGEMHVRMWSTKYWDITAGVSERYDFTQPETRHIEDENCVPHEGYAGFDIDVYRYFHKPGSDEVVRKETMHTTYTPSDTVVCS